MHVRSKIDERPVYAPRDQNKQINKKLKPV